MKRWIILAAAAAAALLLQNGAEKDVAKLEPVQLIFIYRNGNHVCVETDTDAFGEGNDLDSAIQNMKATAPGEIFLDTAEFLVLTDQTCSLLPELTAMIRPAAEICIAEEVEPVTAAEYLSVHRPGVTLKDWMAEEHDFPLLSMTEERYELVS